MKKILLMFLSFMAKTIINKHKPFIIWITWTVGKTTTTNFIYEFLKQIYVNEVYKSEFDYNWEFGLPLTILKSKSPNKNLFLWLLLFFKFLSLYLSKSYPKYLVLEYWIDRIWEMEFLVDIVKPNIAIILNISPNHVTQFPDYNDYIKEKITLWLNSDKVIFNFDDIELRKTFENKTWTLSFWLDKNAFIKWSDLISDLNWLNFKISYDSELINVEFPLLWDHQVYNILPIFALWKLLNLNLEYVYKHLWNIETQKWRWTILKWIKDSIIIDWSYNWWFLSISSWVKYIKWIDWNYNKILFLWEMRELWSESKKLHTELAEILLQWWFNQIVLIWDEMNKYVYWTLLNKFWSGSVFYFKSSKDWGDKIRELIQKNENKSIIYVKWSQNTIFLEEWIKKFLFDAKDISKLCRQSDNWISKKEEFFSHVI